MFDDDRVRQDPASSRRIPDQLSIDLLGRFAVCVGPRTIPCSAWRLRKAKSLLQLLALAPGHRMHRERVLELLWPRDYAQNRDNAANTLYRVLHVLRHVLQPDAPLRHVSEYVALTDDVLILCQSGNLLVDVDAFKEAAASARRTSDSRALARALDLYRGALLLNETDEEWVDGYRTDLHDRYTGLLRSAIRMHLERGDREGAIAHLQLLVTAQPDDEQACVALMCLHAAHQRFAALRLYQRLRESLREIGIEPERATQRLYAQLKKGQLPEHAPQIEYDLSRALDAARADPHPASTSGTRFTAPSSAAPSSAAPSSAAPSSAGQSSAGQSSIASSSEEGEARAVSAGSFVGREREVVEVARLLASHRVVTLSGTGGGGKSRLAREVASQTDLRDGVVIVELAELTDARLVPNVVAAALEAPEEPGRPLVETLARAVAAKEILLLLDNCEHLSAACAALITALLDLCPDLHVLVTSRRHLGVTGERVFPVSPLAFPAPEQLPPFEELQNYGAVRLFCDRVAACAPGFALSPGNAAAVVTICARLDGIPLALELAARRRGHMTSEQLARRLEHALDLLEGTGVQGSGRNETLRATLDWSYMLLDEPERALFRRLAAFAGSWSL
ncbi:MAG TPA: BTAD domain-containing putative transcriptional regulator, partial [Ktedonobacterales bacterium]